MPIITSPNEIAAPSPAATLTVEGKWFGRGAKSLFPNFQMLLPDAWSNTQISLQDLIEGVVRAEVAGFNTRQESRAVLQALSASQIADGVQKGKVGSGLLEGDPQTADADEAVAVALSAFLDGNYFVFVNDEQQTELTGTLRVGSETRVTFLRLVALAGG